MGRHCSTCSCPAPPQYSERTRRLARQLAEKAAQNLRDSGHQVDYDPETGLHAVTRREQLTDEQREAIQRVLDTPVKDRRSLRVDHTLSLLDRLRRKIAETRKKRSS